MKFNLPAKLQKISLRASSFFNLLWKSHKYKNIQRIIATLPAEELEGTLQYLEAQKAKAIEDQKPEKVELYSDLILIAKQRRIN